MIYPYRYTLHKLPSGLTGIKPSPIPAARTRRFRLLPAALITVGSVLVANVVWPLLSYELFTLPSYTQSTWISPLASTDANQTLADKSVTPISPVLGASTDFTNPENWFPKAEYLPLAYKPISYSLDIPAVDIQNAVVSIGGNDLAKNLIQYPGTADPGSLGSTVIIGHSVLRQFYNPSVDNPRRYLSIFSKIMTLKNNDRIYMSYNGVRFTYEVTGKYEISPDDVAILNQSADRHELKLLTCVPEGTYLRRGVVVAQLVDMAGRGATTILK